MEILEDAFTPENFFTKYQTNLDAKKNLRKLEISNTLLETFQEIWVIKQIPVKKYKNAAQGNAYAILVVFYKSGLLQILDDTGVVIGSHNTKSSEPDSIARHTRILYTKNTKDHGLIH